MMKGPTIAIEHHPAEDDDTDEREAVTPEAPPGELPLAQ